MHEVDPLYLDVKDRSRESLLAVDPLCLVCQGHRQGNSAGGRPTLPGRRKLEQRQGNSAGSRPTITGM
jgi:hypothetical protein